VLARQATVAAECGSASGAVEPRQPALDRRAAVADALWLALSIATTRSALVGLPGYRGISGDRHIIMINPDDITRLEHTD
jgi:hypothetical protein